MPSDVFTQEIRSKGSDRIQINSILSGVCIGALSILLTLSNERIVSIVVVQLALAIPFLTTSSLAYAKISYRRLPEIKRWDFLGWATNTIGYIMILNSIALLLFQFEYYAGFWIFLIGSLTLFTIYSLVDLIGNPQRIKEKGSKLTIYYILIISGTLLPIYL